MHCLEDDLELLEDVPAELKHLCCKMRHLDFRVEKERENRIARIHQSYHQIRKLSEDKIAIAEHLHLMLEKYQERISSHLSEIKYVFDTPGD
ncbi:hypothetical protein Ddc_22225 [Ditylenchus destructor]|nr:hypothetical protein Ddc_22225 [Ditylenchus destructor]